MASENVVVTRVHRKLATDALREIGPVFGADVHRFAQALASLEAATAHRCWTEGAKAGLDAENPYPEPR